jgi:hypothetical protein
VPHAHSPGGGWHQNPAEDPWDPTRVRPGQGEVAIWSSPATPVPTPAFGLSVESTGLSAEV